MQKVIKRPGVKLILNGDGITLCRGLLRKKHKFLPWSEVKAVGFYVGDMRHTAYYPDPLMGYPVSGVFNAHSYSARDLFLYFSVFRPTGFVLEDILPVVREERNICINLGGGEFSAISPIFKRANSAAEKILTFYSGTIINREAEYYG